MASQHSAHFSALLPPFQSFKSGAEAGFAAFIVSKLFDNLPAISKKQQRIARS